MSNRRWTIAVSFAIAVVAGTWGIQDSSAQAPPGFKRTELTRHDASTPGKEIVLARAEFQPGAAVPKHTHPGEEVAYLVAGDVDFEEEGKPVRHMKAGDSFFLPPNTVHAAKAGKGGAT